VRRLLDNTRPNIIIVDSRSARNDRCCLSGHSWLFGTGFTRLGQVQTWLLLILPLVYAIAVTVYAMTGSLDINNSNPGLTGIVALFILAAAFLEEVAFRGLILHAFVRLWGETNRGLIKSVLVAALFFGAYHISNILGGTLPDAVLQGVANVSMGIFLGALVLQGRSIYPAVFFHGFWNLGSYLNLTSSTTWGTPTSWLWLSVLYLPLAFFGLVLLRDVWQRPLVFDAA